MKKLIVVLAAIGMLTSCKDRQTAQLSALGKPHIITMYGCDGKIIKQWESTGSVSNSEKADGWYFGLGYFAAWCLRGEAEHVQSYEKNPDVIWLRSHNPWSPEPDDRLTLTRGDIAEQVATLPDQSVDAILHDPPSVSPDTSTRRRFMTSWPGC